MRFFKIRRPMREIVRTLESELADTTRARDSALADAVKYRVLMKHYEDEAVLFTKREGHLRLELAELEKMGVANESS